ncbi:F-box domain containing protein [Parasponia andersonii]|uniref:F-box domain containing protein n=1 Tax=Parasponia andersonii TaxID=3476 RepID=A0A2P5A6F0_PARAD|nr:F-box domain containing protein [Parasponia andersonii]
MGRRSKVRKVLDTPSNTIYSIPSEMVVEILARLAASSMTDFFKTKSSCKLFYEVADDDYIYRQISVEELAFKILHWTKEESSFYNRCMESGNLEALYHQGVHKYFTYHLENVSGLDLLKRAACAGHHGASYVLGIMDLLCHDGDEFTKRGRKILSNIKTSLQMLECRRKLQRSACYKWRLQNKDSVRRPKLLSCPFQDRKRSLWCLYDEDDRDNLHCETCILNREMVAVYRMLTGHSCPSYSYSYGMCLSRSIDQDTTI